MAKQRLSCKEALMKSGPVSSIDASQCDYSRALIISEPQQFPQGECLPGFSWDLH